MDNHDYRCDKLNYEKFLKKERLKYEITTFLKEWISNIINVFYDLS